MGVCIARVELGASFPAHMKRFVFHLYAFNLWFIRHSQSRRWRARLSEHTGGILLVYENQLRVELSQRNCSLQVVVHTVIGKFAVINI